MITTTIAATILGIFAIISGVIVLKHTSNDKWPLSDPRVSGVQEHYDRIQTFLDLVCKSKEPTVIFRLQVACLYFAQGIIEIMKTAAREKHLNISIEQLEETLTKELHWFKLIEKIRIHDFHRFGLIPPNPGTKRFFLGGGLKLIASQGKAMYRIQSTGIKKEETGNSKIEEQRLLISDDDRFYDDETEKYVTIEQILKDFMCEVPAIINKFKSKWLA